MDVFAFREELVAEYERFSRSFANIRAEDMPSTDSGSRRAMRPGSWRTRGFINEITNLVLRWLHI